MKTKQAETAPAVAADVERARRKMLASEDGWPALIEKYAARLVPGDANPAGKPEGDWKPCGRADGVIFLKETRKRNAETKADDIDIPGTERQALNFVLGPKALGSESDPVLVARLAEAMNRMQPGKLGLTRPSSILFLLRRYPSLQKRAEQSGQELDWFFLDFKAARQCNQAEHRGRWVVVPTSEDGVWAVFYE